jgi:hypothetical protein
VERDAALSELEIFDRGALADYFYDTAHLALERGQASAQQSAHGLTMGLASILDR